MLYPYVTLNDQTMILHSQILTDDEVIVQFERPTDSSLGFDSARCMLPLYTWKSVVGYTKDEIRNFEIFLKHNKDTIYEFAKEGGVGCA